MKKIVIAGASSGIGYAVAEALVSRGVRVGVCARRTEKLEKLSEAYPHMVEVARIDVNSKSAAGELQDLIGRLGGMDIYFHVAGIGYSNPTLDPDEEVRILETNVCGFARMVSAAYNYFVRKGGGQIAALTSVAGTKGIGSMSAYSAGKAFDQAYLEALDQLSRIDRRDIVITDIRPGWVRTPLLNDGESYPMEMNLEDVVPQIIKAIVKKKRVAVIDWRWNLLVGLWQHLPHSLWVRIPYKG